MLIFKDVTNECFSLISFEIVRGSTCKIITHSAYEQKILLNTILGMQKPIQGEVLLFDKNIYSISEKELINIFKKSSIVWEDGGSISNLNVWENITLPACYHTGKKPEELEESIINLYKQMGGEPSYLLKNRGKFFGQLPVYERKLLGIIRAMLMEPELIIYDSLLEGLNPESLARITQLVIKFHTEKSDRVSIYVSSNEHSLRTINTDVVLKQEGKGLHYEITQ